MPVERVMGHNRNNMENYGDLQPIARNMKPASWVPGENLSFGLLRKVKNTRDLLSKFLYHDRKEVRKIIWFAESIKI